MYKVFFNGSTIHVGSEMNKSLNNNISQMVDSESYELVNQIIGEVELAENPSDFYVRISDNISGWQHFKNHFVEIPAAGGLVRNASGALLFIKRLGVWDLPKGKIEKKETPEFAALREVEEECGLTNLQIEQQVDSTFHIYRSPYLIAPKNLVLKETKWFLMTYSGDETPVPQLEEDIEEVVWLENKDFDKVYSNTYLSLVELLKNLFPTT